MVWLSGRQQRTGGRRGMGKSPVGTDRFDVMTTQMCSRQVLPAIIDQESDQPSTLLKQAVPGHQTLTCAWRSVHQHNLVCCLSVFRPPGAFCGLQLLAGPALDSIVSSLHKLLRIELIRDPSHEMRWLASLDAAKVWHIWQLHPF